MASIPHTRWWEVGAPVVARLLIGGQFLMGALYKIPGTQGFAMEVGQSAAMGMPYASAYVTIAFALEVVCALAIILGWHARAAACVLAFFTLALAIIFYGNFSDPMTMGMFVSHMGLIAGLLFISVYGAKSFAVRKD